MRFVSKVQAACTPVGAPATAKDPSRKPRINDSFVLMVGGEPVVEGTIIGVEPAAGVIKVSKAKVMNAFEVYEGNLTLKGSTWVLEPEPECF